MEKVFFSRGHGKGGWAERRAILVLALLIPLFLSPEAHGQDELGPRGIKLGPLRVFPGLGVGWEQTDNLFYDDKGSEKSDLLSTLTPGVQLKLPLRRHSLQLSYGSNWIPFNRFDNYTGADHSAGASADFHFPGGLDLALNHRFSAASSPPGSVLDHRSDFQLNTSSAEASYAMGHRLKMVLNYTSTDQDFKPGADEEDSYRENGIWANLVYRISPKTSILLEPGLSRRGNFDRWGPWVDKDEKGNPLKDEKGKPLSRRVFPDSDNDNFRLFLGLQWAATAKLSGTLKGGYILKKFEDGRFQEKQEKEEAGEKSWFRSGNSSKDAKDFGYSIDLTYKLSHATLVGLKGSRKIVETTVTTFIGGEEAEKGSGEDKDKIRKANAAFGTHYTATDLALNVKHRFGYKTTGSFDFGLESNDYPSKGIFDKKRKDFRLGIGVGFNYRFQRWLVWSVNYRYSLNDSNIKDKAGRDIEDYQVNHFSTQFFLAF